jgi:hypothetical protein
MPQQPQRRRRRDPSMIRKSGNRSCGKTTLNWNSDGARVSNEALRIGWKKLIIVMAAPLCRASHLSPLRTERPDCEAIRVRGRCRDSEPGGNAPAPQTLSSHAAPGRERLGLGLVTRERLLVRDAWESANAPQGWSQGTAKVGARRASGVSAACTSAAPRSCAAGSRRPAS